MNLVASPSMRLRLACTDVYASVCGPYKLAAMAALSGGPPTVTGTPGPKPPTVTPASWIQALQDHPAAERYQNMLSLHVHRMRSDLDLTYTALALTKGEVSFI
jgi:hypothetical protein